jgi:hypothetical protein
MKAGKNGRLCLVVLSWGVVLATGGAVGVAEDSVAGLDANWAEPNDAEMFSATWTLVTLSASCSNPAESGATSDTAVTRTLAVSSRIHVGPPGNVFGLSQMLPIDLRAVTDTGAELIGQRGLPAIRTYAPLDSHNNKAMMFRFPMDPNQGYPSVLRQISWTGYALLYRQQQWIDVPFEATDQWVQILPGVQIKFTQVTLREGMYQYEFDGQYEMPTSPFDSEPVVHENRPLPAYLVTQIELLDAEGWTITPQTQYSRSHSLMGTVTGSGGGMCSSCGEATDS